MGLYPRPKERTIWDGRWASDSALGLANIVPLRPGNVSIGPSYPCEPCPSETSPANSGYALFRRARQPKTPSQFDE